MSCFFSSLFQLPNSQLGIVFRFRISDFPGPIIHNSTLKSFSPGAQNNNPLRLFLLLKITYKTLDYEIIGITLLTNAASLDKSYLKVSKL